MFNFWLDREGSAGNWYVFWVEGRRTKRRSMRTDAKALAKERMKLFVEKFLAALNKADGQTAKANEVSILAVLIQYHEDHGGSLMSSETAERAFNNLKDHYKTEMVSYINKTTNKEYEKKRQTDWQWSNSTINRERAYLRAALEHAVENGDLDFAPAIPTLPEPPANTRWLSRKEVARLLRNMPGRRLFHVKVFTLIALYTGARHRAILQLTWDRVHFEEGRIDFRLPGQPETKKKRPHAPVNRKLMNVLRYAYRRAVIRAERDGTDLCPFVVRYGFMTDSKGNWKPLGSVRTAIETAVEEASLQDVTPHTFKHTAITWMLRNKVSVWDVSGLTNTSPETIKRVYGHHIPDALAEAANAPRA